MMARGIVQPRPFIKTKPQPISSGVSLAGFPRGKKIKKSEILSFFIQKYILIVISALALLFLGIFLLKGTFYNPSYQIQTIDYPASTRAKYENTELFVLTSKLLRGQYYSALQIGGVGGLLSKIRQEYPFVRDVKVTYIDPQTVSVEYDFDEPDFLVKLGEKRFWVRKWGVTDELSATWALGQTGFVVDTPNYLSGTISLSGFFYDVGWDWYMQYLPLIQQSFPEMSRFVYLAGSPNFLVFENSKTIILHKENLPHQIQKYHRLKHYFPNFAGTYEIDLGSLLENKVIVME